MSPAALTTGKFKVLVGNIIHLKRRFSTGVPRKFLKHEIPDSLVRGTDLFPLDCQIKKLQQPTQQSPSGVNESKLYLFAFVRLAKNIFLGVS